MAYTPAYTVNNQTAGRNTQINKTTLNAFMVGNTGFKKGAKIAVVKMTFTAADVYTASGVAANMLGQLPGWTSIEASFGVPYYNSNTTAAWEIGYLVAQNDATPGNRLMLLCTLLGGAEVANGRVLTSVTIPFVVIGY